MIRNISRATTEISSRPFSMYGLPPSYTLPMATTYMGQTPTWYPNPLFDPMFLEMPQIGTQIAAMPISQYTMPQQWLQVWEQ